MTVSARKVIAEPFEWKDTITLDSIDRYKRRIMLTSDKGCRILLDLERAQLLRDGQGLVLDDGEIIRVCAKPEALYEVRAITMTHLLCLAWQLGNRHQPAEISTDHIKIRRDQVIAEMVKGLGGEVIEIMAHFNPQGGAYDHAHARSNA